MDAQDKKIATDLSYEIIKEVSRAIRPYVGKPESGEKVKMGADGTPTSFIDIVAEEKVVNILKNAPVLSYLVSEEIGELKLGKGTQKSITLTHELRRDDLEEEEIPKFIFLVDPIDGTSNAIKEIPAYGISMAVANVPRGRVATLDDVELGFISNIIAIWKHAACHIFIPPAKSSNNEVVESTHEAGNKEGGSSTYCP